MLTISNLHYRIEGRPLFDGASVVLPTGAKAGFVGKNGSGKTTLFHLIQGHISPEQGTVEVHKRARIGAVAQEAPAGSMSVIEMVLSADTEIGRAACRGGAQKAGAHVCVASKEAGARR